MQEPQALSLTVHSLGVLVTLCFRHSPHGQLTALGAILTQHCFFRFSYIPFVDESVFQVSFSDGGVEPQLSEQGSLSASKLEGV